MKLFPEALGEGLRERFERNPGGEEDTKVALQFLKPMHSSFDAAAVAETRPLHFQVMQVVNSIQNNSGTQMEFDFYQLQTVQ
jgi:hypothetical protein